MTRAAAADTAVAGEAIRWLILPDIHDKLRRANQIIEREPHDRLLLLGDFFDDFRTGVTDAADTATQVKQWLNSPNTTCLLGNHDMSYGWCRQNRQLLCPGYDQMDRHQCHGDDRGLAEVQATCLDGV